MKKRLKIDGEFKRALPVLEKIWEAGFEAYYVGGSVRDRLLGLPVNDVDIATSAQPHEIKAIFKRTVDVGIEHGTILVLAEGSEYEITTFRTESTYHDFRRPDEVTFVRSLNEDLKRRDFTMNAIAMDEAGQLKDPYGGLQDIESEIIRAVGNPHERFSEDALRMMRAVRFAGQLNFEIEAETLKSIKKNAPLLEKIAVERIQVEFEKLLTGKWRQEGLKAMISTELYRYCPGLDSQKEAILALIEDKKRFENPESAWAFLIYQIDHYNRASSFKEKRFLVKWKLSNKMINAVRTLYNGLKKRVQNDEIDPLDIFCLGEQAALKIEDLMVHLGKPAKHEEVSACYQALTIHEKNELAITGHDIMQLSSTKAGPWLGEAMDYALKAVVYKEVSNTKEEIIEWLIDENKILGILGK